MVWSGLAPQENKGGPWKMADDGAIVVWWAADPPHHQSGGTIHPCDSRADRLPAATGGSESWISPWAPGLYCIQLYREKVLMVAAALAYIHLADTPIVSRRDGLQTIPQTHDCNPLFIRHNNRMTMGINIQVDKVASLMIQYSQKHRYSRPNNYLTCLLRTGAF